MAADIPRKWSSCVDKNLDMVVSFISMAPWPLLQNHLECLFKMQTFIIKKSANNKCWRGCGEKGNLLHCWWECKLIQPLWRTVWRFLKKLKIELPYDPAVPLLGLYPEKTIIQNRVMYHDVDCSSIYNSRDMDTT